MFPANTSNITNEHRTGAKDEVLSGVAGQLQLEN